MPTVPADLVLRNATVFTNDPARPRVHSVAVRGSRVVAAGSEAETASLVGLHTRVLDVHGGAVIPALTDAHGHLSGLDLSLRQVRLESCHSPEDCAQRVSETVRSAAPDAWILGRGWDQNLFPGQQFPGHGALDAVSAGHPVWLRRVDGHAAWANARALSLAGVTALTADPPGGRILRGPRGEPTGVLVDAAERLVNRVVPRPSREQLAQAILAAQALLVAQGLTSVHEMDIRADVTEVYRALAASGRLELRVYASVAADDPESLERAFAQGPDASTRDALFVQRGLKLYADGALGSRGAALLGPYTDEPALSGLVVTPEPVLEVVSRRALAAGFQVCVHAIGDAANRSVLDAYTRAGVTPAARFRIEHAQVVDPTDVPRFAALGVIASMQPTHATSDMPWAEHRLGHARIASAYAWRTMLDAGVRLALGSDFPVESSDPRLGLFAAVGRTEAHGRPPGGWMPDQRLTLDEAVRGFSLDAAFAAFEEDHRGRVRPGDVADLTVFDRPLEDDRPGEILEAHVLLTLVNGRVVFDSAAAFTAPLRR